MTMTRPVPAWSAYTKAPWAKPENPAPFRSKDLSFTRVSVSEDESIED